MKINIKRIDNTLPLPQYQTTGACAFDIYSRIDITISPKQFEKIPTNLIIQVPKGYALLTALRSSTPIKRNLIMGNAPGIVDQDYHGPKDEIYLALYNLSDQEVQIKKGERIAQGMFVKIGKPKWQEAQNTKKKSRGGFGSTGK